MIPLSKTMQESDYAFLTNYVLHIDNIINLLASQPNPSPNRMEHHHRRWEYAMIYYALDRVGAKNILDIGGGGSVFESAMAWTGKDIIVVDPGDIGNWIEQQNKKLNLSHPITHIQKFLDDFDTKQKFDAVVCISVLEHIENDIEAIIKMMKYVKVGGLLALTVDFHPSGVNVLPKDAHLRTYNKESLLRLAKYAATKGFSFFEGINYDTFEPNVNGCDFATFIMKKNSKAKEHD